MWYNYVRRNKNQIHKLQKNIVISSFAHIDHQDHIHYAQGIVIFGDIISKLALGQKKEEKETVLFFISHYCLFSLLIFWLAACSNAYLQLLVSRRSRWPPFLSFSFYLFLLPLLVLLLLVFLLFIQLRYLNDLRNFRALFPQSLDELFWLKHSGYSYSCFPLLDGLNNLYFRNS